MPEARNPNAVPEARNPNAVPEARGSDAVLDRLMALHPKRIDLVLDRVWRLLHALGEPAGRAAAGDPRRGAPTARAP